MIYVAQIEDGIVTRVVVSPYFPSDPTHDRVSA